MKNMNFFKIFFISLILLGSTQSTHPHGKTMKFKLSALQLPVKGFQGNDPYVICYIKDNATWQKFGETEVLDRKSRPSWSQMFTFEHVNGTGQKLKFVVRDWALGSSPDRHLGRAEVWVDELVGEFSKYRMYRVGIMKNMPVQLRLSQPTGGILIYTPLPA